MTTVEPHVHRWTRDEYYQMAHVGLFQGRHVELIDGRVIEMSPIERRPVIAVTRATEALRDVFGSSFHVQVQAPLNLGERSEPEPDLAVVEGRPEDHMEHPTTAALLVEVSESSLAFDRREKASLYARAGFEEYWIVNLVDEQLEIHRQPAPMPEQPHGFGYAETTFLKKGSEARPLLAEAALAVADLLP